MVGPRLLGNDPALVAVLIPGIGLMRYGARRWFDLGFFQLQPSEFAKLAFIFALGNFLSRPPDELRIPAQLFQSARHGRPAVSPHHEGTGPGLGPDVSSCGLWP